MRHYVGVLRRGLWIILLCAGLGTAAAVYVSSREKSLYRSSAQVFLNTQNLAALFSNVPQTSLDPARAAETQAALARAPDIAARALAASDARSLSVDEFLRHSSVTTSLNADLLTFFVSDQSPRVAGELATAYAQAYTRYRRALDTTFLIKARGEVDRQIEQLSAAGQRNSPIYQDLVDKSQQLRTMELLQSSNAQLVRPARGAEKVQPRPVRNGILAFALSLMLGMGLAFVRDALDTRVRSSDEIEARLGLPLLGRIPEPPRRLRNRDALVMLEMPHSPHAEAFRILATNIELKNLDRPARKIMVTSALSGEGKSTTVANLAVAFARSGRRVALVDMDMRRPYLDRFLLTREGPTVGAPGLTQVVLGRSTLDEVLVPINVSNHKGKSADDAGSARLELFTAGPIVSSPSELFASQGLTDVFAQLEQRADFVLIDAPPMLQVSDTIALSARVDALIVVANPDVVRRPVLNELRRVIDAAPVVKLGFVLTGAKGEDGYGDGSEYSYRERVAEVTQPESVS